MQLSCGRGVQPARQWEVTSAAGRDACRADHRQRSVGSRVRRVRESCAFIRTLAIELAGARVRRGASRASHSAGGRRPARAAAWRPSLRSPVDAFLVFSSFPDLTAAGGLDCFVRVCPSCTRYAALRCYDSNSTSSHPAKPVLSTSSVSARCIWWRCSCWPRARDSFTTHLPRSPSARRRLQALSLIQPACNQLITLLLCCLSLATLQWRQCLRT